MKIIPVLDLMNGVVVRGVGGRRAEYQPVVSKLTKSTDPADVLKALTDVTGSDVAYVADLDAIMGKVDVSPAALRLIKSTTKTLWIDYGIRNFLDFDPIPTFKHVVPVLGTETMLSLSMIGPAIEHLGEVICSLDLFDENVIHPDSPIQNEEMQVVQEFVDHGVKQIILLEISCVGMGYNRITSLCGRLTSAFPKVEFFPGGGICSKTDLEEYQAAGAAGVLVSSALHDGRLP